MRLVLSCSVAFVLGSAFVACGGRGINPAMQGKQGMLSETAIAQKCEAAKEGHDRPFVVEWDATDLSSFEAATRQRTMFVKYEGCSLKVLYECRDPNVIARFGAYGPPDLTSGTVQGFDIKNQGELYAKLPLGAATLSGRLEEGEALHLKYFVSGVATNSRESVYRNELASAPGCEGATHFVWGYNLGAFELDTSSKTSAEAEGSMAGVGAAGGKGSREQSAVARGGDIGSCSTQDQRGCRVPIRLSLRPIRPGDNPLDKPVAYVPPAPGTAPQLPAGLQESMNAAASAREAITTAVAKLNDSHDGVGCLQLLDKALSIDPRSAEDRALQFNYPRCLMRAGKCDEGTKRQRQRLAAEDTKRLLTDAELDEQARNSANYECPSSTAKNDIDLVIRASRELNESARVKNVKECKAGFEKVATKMQSADAQWKQAREATRRAPSGQHPWNMGTTALNAAAKCVAESSSCKDGLAYYKRAYCMQLRDMDHCAKFGEDSWNSQLKAGHIVCK